MHLRATTISDAWYQILYNFGSEAYRQDIEKGSFEKENYRLQIPWLSLEIMHPLQDMIPIMPPGCNIPCPNTIEYVKEYFVDYLLGGKSPGKNESYTYALRIDTQLPKALEMLKKTPSTNQASIIVGRPEDLDLQDPACLRAIDLKIHNGRLDLATFWRSWDIWAGLPTNLGGLALLMEYISEEVGFAVGVLRAASQGAHLYGYQLPFVRARLGRAESI
jgi:thymidylate synthase